MLRRAEGMCGWYSLLTILAIPRILHEKNMLTNAKEVFLNMKLTDFGIRKNLLIAFTGIKLEISDKSVNVINYNYINKWNESLLIVEVIIISYFIFYAY